MGAMVVVVVVMVEVTSRWQSLPALLGGGAHVFGGRATVQAVAAWTIPPSLMGMFSP